MYMQLCTPYPPSFQRVTMKVRVGLGTCSEYTLPTCAHVDHMCTMYAVVWVWLWYVTNARNYMLWLVLSVCMRNWFGWSSNRYYIPVFEPPLL